MKNIEKLYTYFSAKTKEILAAADQAILSHHGLIGDHREKIINTFLSDFLPQKYSIGTGQFMSIEFQRDYESKQSDVIIWDSFDYPKVRLQGNASLFFAESVKMIIEVKSNFNEQEFEDIRSKSKHLKRFVPSFHPSIKEEIWRLDNKIARSVKGKMEMKMMASSWPVPMSTICLKGGQNFDLSKIKNVSTIEDEIPDALLLLEAGKLVTKTYKILPGGKVNGELVLHQLDDNSLIGFVGWVMGLLAERDTNTTSPFQFQQYIQEVYIDKITQSITFPVSRPAPGIEIIN